MPRFYSIMAATPTQSVMNACLSLRGGKSVLVQPMRRKLPHNGRGTALEAWSIGMEFWDQLFDSDYKRRADIESLKQIANSRKRARRQDRRETADQQKRIEQLEDQVGELALLCRSLLTVLRETEAVQPERFEEVMKQIDAEDGVVDGKITPENALPKDPNAIPEIRPWPKKNRMR